MKQRLFKLMKLRKRAVFVMTSTVLKLKVKDLYKIIFVENIVNLKIS